MKHDYVVTAEIDGKTVTKKYVTVTQARRGLQLLRAKPHTTSAYLFNRQGTTLEGFGPAGRNYR